MPIVNISSSAILAAPAPGSPFLIRGSNPEIDIAAVPQDVWQLGFATGGISLYPFPLAPVAVSVSSISPLDDGVIPNTGARTVDVIGLDAAFNTITETVTLAGVAPVLLANTYFRLNVARVATAGTAGTNVGDITFNPGPLAIGIIPKGIGNLSQCIFTMPGDLGPPFKRQLLQFQIHYGVQPQANLNLALFVRPSGGAWSRLDFGNLMQTGDTNYTKRYDLGFGGSLAAPFPPGTDFRVTCVTASTNNIEAGAGLDFEV